MRHDVITALVGAALLAAAPAIHAQETQSVPAIDAENGTLWFVELATPPTADGASLAQVRNDKAAFRQAARNAGARFEERRAFDVLFNGFSVRAERQDLAKLANLPGVRAVYPVEVIHAPPATSGSGSAPDMEAAVKMTGADVVQNALGFTGKGVKVAVMDTGIDLEHPDFGGTGENGDAVLPSGRIVAGWDFVGDDFNADSSSPAYHPNAKPDAIPDDCGGHGTHVAGIVGANGRIKGVAPEVSFGAYRVFGCAGSTTSDIMIAAMERAYADGMQVLNMSIGSRAQWPQYPTGAAATRLVNKGMVVVASAGNNGPGGGAPDGLWAGGAPGVGQKVISVASFDNTHATKPAFTVTPDGQGIGYNQATGAPTAPQEGSLPLAQTGTPTAADDACAPLTGSYAGQAVLVRRGTCGFHVKALNAQNAGAAAVVLYNNVAGEISPTVAGTPAITIPVVAVTASDGTLLSGRITAGATTMTWTAGVAKVPMTTGGLISGFSSFGLSPDLALKPNLGAPGGQIYSTIPLEQGEYGPNSGTSMAAPHVAGAVALLLQAKPSTPSNGVLARLQNSADPAKWSGNPSLGFLDNVHRQGAGMLDIAATIQAPTLVEPSQLALGESEAGPQTRTLTIRNEGSSAQTYALSHASALATGPNTGASTFAPSGTFDTPATVAFSAAQVTVPAGGSATVDVTITAPAGLVAGGIYGGYVVLTPAGDGNAVRVPFAGFKGDYQSTVVLTPTANGFPWLAKLAGTSFARQADHAVWTLSGGDVPYILMHLDHQARRIRLEAIDAVTGASWYTISDEQYVGRNTSRTGFFTWTWDGRTYRGGGRNGPTEILVPDGEYKVKVSVLKALGDDSNPAHWETWTSPVITIKR
jgi:minor extracellular serine protease Vpr